MTEVRKASAAYIVIEIGTISNGNGRPPQSQKVVQP